ncbi:MAG: AbrB/MazE/SpoVT family DNA-binding domain-containing protein [bacterium]|nr:AbrB/MazE/SpoVT family DNA-binding domain-containing protein [bacterium]
MRRKLEDRHIRKIQKSGRSYFVRLPIELVRKYGWQEKQKLVVEEAPRKRITIRDWKK